jgi:hypothetical protein
MQHAVFAKRQNINTLSKVECAAGHIVSAHLPPIYTDRQIHVVGEEKNYIQNSHYFILIISDVIYCKTL